MLIDEIAVNAKILGKLVNAVNKAERRNWNIGPHDEFAVQRYYEVLREQKALLEKFNALQK